MSGNTAFEVSVQESLTFEVGVQRSSSPVVVMNPVHSYEMPLSGIYQGEVVRQPTHSFEISGLGEREDIFYGSSILIVETYLNARFIGTRDGSSSMVAKTEIVIQPSVIHAVLDGSTTFLTITELSASPSLIEAIWEGKSSLILGTELTAHGSLVQAIWEGSAMLSTLSSMYISNIADNYMMEEQYFSENYFAEKYFPE